MGELPLFYLLHTKITMNIIEMAVQINEGVQINGIRINEGPLYPILPQGGSSVIERCHPYCLRVGLSSN